MPTAAGPPTGRLFFFEPPEPVESSPFAISRVECIYTQILYIYSILSRFLPLVDSVCTRTPVPNPLILGPLISVDPELPIVVHRLHATLPASATGGLGGERGKSPGQLLRFYS